MAITKDDDMTAPDSIQPGEHLAEFLNARSITQYGLAKTIGVPQMRMSEMIHGRRSIAADTALRLGRACDMTPEFWIALQRMSDLDIANCTSKQHAMALHPKGLEGSERHSE